MSDNRKGVKQHVKQVINLWKSTTRKDSEVVPYQMTQQLRSIASLFSPGLFYYYILDFPNLKFEYIHEGTREILGLEPEELNMEKLIGVLAPEERVPMGKKEAVVVDFLVNFLSPEQALNYKAVYFVKLEDTEGRCHDILHQATILTQSEDNRIEHVMVVHTDVSHLNFIKKDTVSFISLNGGKSYFDVDIEKGCFDPGLICAHEKMLGNILTRREKELVKLMAEGKSADELSAELNLSVHTIRTHRKNLLKKSGCRNTTEIVAKCLVEGII